MFSTNTIIGIPAFSTTSMFTKFHYILHHSPPRSKRHFSILGVPRQGALHPLVRAPTMAYNRFFFFFLFITIFFNLAVVSSSQSDAEILLKFRESLKNTGKLLNWDVSKPPCSGWNGVVCEKGQVWGLQLEGMGLHGVIDVEALAKLKDLRSVSFINNDFDGALPDWKRLGALKTIFMSNNKFSGEIREDAFSRMLSLKKLHLANNKFTGPIPQSLVALPKLMELSLQNNEFEGEIPLFKQHGLKLVNLSNNKLEGHIPPTLTNLDASSFSGNKDLCGAPLGECPTKEEVEVEVEDEVEGEGESAHHSKGKSVRTIVVVAVIAGVALLAILALVMFLICRKKKAEGPPTATATAAGGDLNRMERGVAVAAGGSSELQGKQAGGVKLSFLKEDVERFEMQDLLKASAEVLGSGVIGSTYKAALSGGNVMVVKRCKHMNSVSKEDFNEHMRRLGRLNHQNVLPLVAFYYRKEEKLLVSPYAHNLSLAVRLHGNRSGENPALDWPTRLNIVKGMSKGLVYLHNELPSLTAAHGHLTSSNVLLDASYKPLLADYGLIPIVNAEHAEQHLASYKSPEFKDGRRLTKKSDIWSLGMLILETLTARKNGAETDLPTWVESAMRDQSGGSAVVFDREMAGASHSQGEMMKLLNLGLSCCHADVERRPEIREVVEKIEEIKEKDFDDDYYSSYASESDIRSSRGLSDDFKPINI